MNDKNQVWILWKCEAEDGIQFSLSPEGQNPEYAMGGNGKPFKSCVIDGHHIPRAVARFTGTFEEAVEGRNNYFERESQMNDYEKICGKEIVEKLHHCNKLNRHWNKIFIFSLVIVLTGAIAGAILKLVPLIMLSCWVSLLFTGIGSLVADYSTKKAGEVCDDIREITQGLNFADAISILRGTHIDYAYGSSKLLKLGRE